MPSTSSDSYNLNEFTEHVNAKIDTLTAVVQKLVESKKEAVRSVVTSPAECCTPSLRSVYSWDEFFNIGAPYNTYAVYEDNRVYCTGCPKTRQKGYPVNFLTRLPNGNKTPAFTRILHHIKVHTRSAYHI